MFEDTSLKIKLYLWPIILIVVGGRIAIEDDWFWGGVGIIIIGAVIAAQLLFVSIVRERTNYIKERTDYFVTMERFYRYMDGMNEESKYLFGLAYMPKEVTVKLEKTEAVGNEFSQLWQKLPIAPYKLKVLAQASINGERFSFNKWAGKGKLLTDPEWRALKDKMLELGLISQIDPSAPTMGFDWTGLGIDVMEQCVKDNIVVAKSS